MTLPRPRIAEHQNVFFSDPESRLLATFATAAPLWPATV
jgi:hypothetical protein